MAKGARGLPSNFALDLPDERPVTIGDFLDEPPPPMPAPRRQVEPAIPRESVRQERVYEPDSDTGRFARSTPALAPTPALKRKPTVQNRVIRYQLNLNPKSKKMFEELVEYVQTYSPEANARPSEIFQGIIGLLHAAKDHLELQNLPRRGAWGSVTAKNFPGALGEVFEAAIVSSSARGGKRHD